MERNIIYNEDCIKGMERIPDGSVDLVVTDCPYRICSGGGMSFRDETCILSSKRKDTKSGKLFNDNDLEFEEWLPVIYRKLKEQAHCYIMVNCRNLCELQTKAEQAGFEFHNLLIWDKGNSTPNRWYMQSYECILFLRKGAAKTINNPSSKNLISIPNKHQNRLHPTEKPVKLMEYLIQNSSSEGDLVLDPFMGSGTTAVACMHTGRDYIGFELNKEYYDVIQKRISNERRQLTIW